MIVRRSISNSGIATGVVVVVVIISRRYAPHSCRRTRTLPRSYVTSSTTQFPLLWLSVFGNATGGLTHLSSGRLMMTDIWVGVAPSIVTASFTTGYVSSLGIGMAAGRFGWSALSEYLGRQNTYSIFGCRYPRCRFGTLPRTYSID